MMIAKYTQKKEKMHTQSAERNHGKPFPKDERTWNKIFRDIHDIKIDDTHSLDEQTLDEKLDLIIDHLGSIRGTVERINEQVYANSSNHKNNYGYDVIYNEAKKLAIKTGYASAGLFQRKLHIGYARACGLLDMLEQRGIIDPADGAKPRDILIE